MAPETHPTATGPLPVRQGASGRVPMEFHHVGIAVRSIARALDDYVGLFGYRKVSTTLDVPSEHVKVCFLEAASGERIELVEGLDEFSAVAGVLERAGGGPYHICYSVEDLDAAVGWLREKRCRLVKRFDQPAYGHRRFAYLLTPERQLFELCEPDPRVEGELSAAAQPPYSFHTIFFEATRLCDLACPMCMVGSNDAAVVRQSRRQELTTDEIERYILATAREVGVKAITWSGGEFLLRPDAVELVRRATDYGYGCTVASNASRTSEEQLLELREASRGGLIMAVGINSIEDENSWTRDAGCDLAVEMLALCERLGIRRHAVVNVGKHNLDSLERTLQWLEDRNIPFNRSPFTRRGSGSDYWHQLRFTREDMERTIHPALRSRPNGYFSFTPFFLSPELHDRVSGGSANVTAPQDPSIGCWCGSWLAVSAEGEVAPCGILIDVLQCGNVRDKSFREIVDQSAVFQQVLDRNLLGGKCGRCRYQFTCGGCRAMALFEHGDLMGEDPTCFFDPVDRSTVSEHEAETNRMFGRYAFMARIAEQKIARDVENRKQETAAGDLSAERVAGHEAERG